MIFNLDTIFVNCFSSRRHLLVMYLPLSFLSPIVLSFSSFHGLVVWGWDLWTFRVFLLSLGLAQGLHIIILIIKRSFIVIDFLQKDYSREISTPRRYRCNYRTLINFDNYLSLTIRNKTPHISWSPPTDLESFAQLSLKCDYFIISVKTSGY